MAYTGAWRNRRGYVDRAAPLGGSRPYLHLASDPQAAGSRPPYAAPRVDEVPPAVTDDMQTYDPVLERQARGRPLNTEPVTHEADLDAPGLAHQLDRGAADRQRYMPPDLRAADERYSTPRVELAPIDDGSRIGALRGRNSLDVNNPDGFRNGIRVRRYLERKIPMRRRTHDLRPLYTRLAAAPQDSPPMPDGNRYTSPFSSNALSRRRTLKPPVQRRIPRPWDEDVTADGVADAAPAPQYAVWGL